MTETFCPCEIFGVPILLSDDPSLRKRVVPGTEGFCKYMLRHGDDEGVPVALEHYVKVNYYATIYSLQPLLAEGRDAYREISPDDLSYDPQGLGECTVEDFLKEYAQNKTV